MSRIMHGFCLAGISCEYIFSIIIVIMTSCSKPITKLVLLLSEVFKANKSHTEGTDYKYLGHFCYSLQLKIRVAETEIMQHIQHLFTDQFTCSFIALLNPQANSSE